MKKDPDAFTKLIILELSLSRSSTLGTENKHTASQFLCRKKHDTHNSLGPVPKDHQHNV